MIGFPLDSHVEYEDDGTPLYDRAVSSEPLRNLIKSLFSNGVLPNPSNNLQVSAGTGMNVLVSAGFAMVDGCMKLEDTQRTLALQASSTTYDRIDSVVMRLNTNDDARYCDLYVIEGNPATSPVRPDLTRSGSIYEIGLADIFVAKNSAAISNQRITDTRYEADRCGVISSISEFDTTTLYQQVKADLNGFKEEEQAEFVEWFANIRDQLSEDAAGKLQNEIDETNTAIGVLENLKTAVKSSIVNALNWLADKIGGTDISQIGDGTVTGAISTLNSNLMFSNKYKKVLVTGLTIEAGKIPVVAFQNFSSDSGAGFDVSHSYLLQDYLPDEWNSNNTIIIAGEWQNRGTHAGTAQFNSGEGINTHFSDNMTIMYARYPAKCTYAAFWCLCMRTDL